jgi:hypothetical protein
MRQADPVAQRRPAVPIRFAMTDAWAPPPPMTP